MRRTTARHLLCCTQPDNTTQIDPTTRRSTTMTTMIEVTMTEHADLPLIVRERE